MIIKNSIQVNGHSDDTKTIVTVLLLIFMFPVGVLVMIFWTKWKTWLKVLITLIGLLPFVLIMAALVALIVANPVPLLQKSQDAVRFSDMANLQKTITDSLYRNPNQKLCGIEKAPCGAASNDKSETIRKTDGTGWVKIALPSLDELPIDPAADDTYYYFYCSDGKDWEINAFLQSPDNQIKSGSDGGDDPDIFEVGSKLTICAYDN